MRAIHLLSLTNEQGGMAHPGPLGDGPLVLPGFISKPDREVVTAFAHRLVSERPPPRIEVDWHGEFLPTSARYLERTRAQLGSSGAFLVVRARREAPDLGALSREPLVRQFDRTVISTSDCGRGESLEPLRRLAKLVEKRLEHHYERLVGPLGLRPSGFDEIRGILYQLLNPIDMTQAVNAHVELQLLERPPADGLVELKRRVVLRKVRWRTPEWLAGLWLAATGRLDEDWGLGSTDSEEVRRRLVGELLLEGPNLGRWGQMIASPEVAFLLFRGDTAPLPTTRQRQADSNGVLARAGLGGVISGSWLPRLRKIIQAATTGRIEEATARQQQLELSLAAGGAPIPSDEVLGLTDFVVSFFKGDHEGAAANLPYARGLFPTGQYVVAASTVLRNLERWDDLEALLSEVDVGALDARERIAAANEALMLAVHHFNKTAWERSYCVSRVALSLSPDDDDTFWRAAVLLTKVAHELDDSNGVLHYANLALSSLADSQEPEAPQFAATMLVLGLHAASKANPSQARDLAIPLFSLVAGMPVAVRDAVEAEVDDMVLPDKLLSLLRSLREETK